MPKELSEDEYQNYFGQQLSKSKMEIVQAGLGNNLTVSSKKNEVNQSNSKIFNMQPLSKENLPNQSEQV